MISNNLASAQRATDRVLNQVSATTKQAARSVHTAVSNNRNSLLSSAKSMQELGDQTSTAGVLMAVAGAPVSGVGALPGSAVVTLGKVTSLTGVGLEVMVEFVAGNDKNALLTAGNEVAYDVLGSVGNKVVERLMPGPTRYIWGQIKHVTKSDLGL